MDSTLDAVVCGVGTGGTLTGLSRFFARTAPQVEMVLADPAGSVLAALRQDRQAARQDDGSWLVEGIGGDSVPPVADFSRVRQAYTIPDAEAFRTCRELLAKEGIIAGTSTGTLLAAALRYCREQTHAEAGRHLRLRQRQQVPVQGLQRLLDARPGLPRARAASATCAT